MLFSFLLSAYVPHIISHTLRDRRWNFYKRSLHFYLPQFFFKRRGRALAEIRWYVGVFVKLAQLKLCLIVHRHPSKIIRNRRYFRFRLLTPSWQPKGFLAKHQHTMHFLVPFFFLFLLKIFL